MARFLMLTFLALLTSIATYTQIIAADYSPANLERLAEQGIFPSQNDPEIDAAEKTTFWPSQISLTQVASTAWDFVNRAIIVGNYCYCYYQEGLQILDITDPAAPVIMSQARCPSMDTHGMVYSQGYIYAVVGEAKSLVVFNVSDPLNCTLAGTYSTPSIATDIVISGNYLYLVYGTKIGVYDITVPGSPQYVNQVTTASILSGISLSGGNLLAVGTTTQMFNLNNPTNPTLLGSYPYKGGNSRTTIAGNYGYSVGNVFGLNIYSLVNPAIPAPISFYPADTPHTYRQVAVYSNHAYALAYSKLDVVSVANPASPYLTVSVPLSTYSRSANVGNGKLVVGDFYDDLRFFDVSSPGTPNLIGDYRPYGQGWDVAVVGHYAFESTFDGKLQVIDVADPRSPVVVTVMDLTGRAYELAAKDGYIYIASGPDGVRIVDISNPLSPQIVGNIATPASAQTIIIRENRAYVMGGGSTLQILDISNPLSASLLGSIAAGGNALNFGISGNLAFLTQTTFGGVMIVDISDPAAPTHVGTFMSSGYFEAVAAEGNLVYAFDDVGHFIRVIDVSDPANPVQVGQGSNYGWRHPRKATKIGNLLYAMDPTAHISVFDATNPINPSYAAECGFQEVWVYGFAVTDSFLYVAGDNSFIVLKQEIAAGPDGVAPIDISDVVFLINYIFGGGPAPVPLSVGDVDCVSGVDISDAVYLINFIFSGGPAPCVLN